MKDAKRSEASKLSEGPYKIQYESCDCYPPCSCGPPYPYEIYAPNRMVKKYDGKFEECAVIANLVESTDCTEADAYLLSASWDLFQYVKRQAEAGDEEAVRLVEFAMGARCPECQSYSEWANVCDECDKRWQSHPGSGS